MLAVSFKVMYRMITTVVELLTFCDGIGYMEDGARAALGQTVSDSGDVCQQWYDRASSQCCLAASDKEACTDVSVGLFCERVWAANDGRVSGSTVQLCAKLCRLQPHLLLSAS